MTPDAAREVASVESYKAVAPKDPPKPPMLPFRVVDGIVPDPKYPAGPHAVILPATSISAN